MTTPPQPLIGGLADFMPRFEASFDRWLLDSRSGAPTDDMVSYHFGAGEPAFKKGKRLRPRLLLAVALDAEEDPAVSLDDALCASCAIEMLHNYSLVHDDIEDGDRIRHGRPAVWTRFGTAHGINTGDMMCALSFLSLARPGRISDPVIALEMTHVLQEAALAMCAGQGLDITFEGSAHVSFAEYLRMIDGKTAALFSAACELGAIAARRSPIERRAYARCGAAYGRAFQIRDDILGIWGSASSTGKPVGADLRRRKWCFPVTWALAGETSAARSTVADAYAATTALDDETVVAVIAALDELGARTAAASAAADAIAEANATIAASGIDRKGAMRALFEASVERLA